MTEKKRDLKSATKYFKAALAGTLLASIGNAYTFDVINADNSQGSEGEVQVEQLFKMNNVLSDNSFKDVSPEYWGLDSIKWAVSTDLLKIDSNGNFRPNDNLTEAEFAHILVSYYKLNNTDVKGSYIYTMNHWADETYAHLAKYGVPMLGYDKMYFRDRPVKRGLFAQAISYINGNEEDIDGSVKYLFDLALTQGKYPGSDNLLERYGVSDNMTRVQSAMFLHRMFNKGIVEKQVEVAEIRDQLEEKKLVQESNEKVDDISLTDEEVEEKQKGSEKYNDYSEVKGSVVVSKDSSKTIDKTSKPTSNKTTSNKTTSNVSKSSDSGSKSTSVNKGNTSKTDSSKSTGNKSVDNSKAKAEAERKAKAEAERKAKAEADRKAKAEAERKAKAEAERKAKEEAERKAKEEAERKAKEEAERKAKEEAERKKREEENKNNGSDADKVSGVYSSNGMNVVGDGNGYAAYGNGHEHSYNKSGKRMLIKFTGNYGTFDIATSALSKLGININVKNGATQLANSGKMSVTVSGVTYSIDGTHIMVKW